MKKQYKNINFIILFFLILAVGASCLVVPPMTNTSSSSNSDYKKIRANYTDPQRDGSLVFIGYKYKLTVKDPDKLKEAVVFGLAICYDSGYANSGSLLVVFAEVDGILYAYKCEYKVFTLFIQESINLDTLLDNVFYEEVKEK